MKILHVITGLRRDGAQRTLLRLACDLAARGIASRVIALGPRDGLVAEFEAAGVAVTCLDLGDLARPRAWGRLCGRLRVAAETLRAERDDVIAGWLYHGNLAASFLSLCAARETPVVWNIRHSLDDPRGDKALTRAFIRLGALCSGGGPGHPERIVYNARRAATQHGLLGYARAAASVIANGVDTSVFMPPAPEARAAWRARLPGSPGTSNPVWIGMNARPHPVKDHAGLVAAAALLRPRLPEARFLLLGRGLDVPGHPVRGLIRATGLEDVFFCPGEAADAVDVAGWIGACDLAVSSSRGEGFPNAVLEAMACGVPVVATDVGDTAGLVGDTGLIVAPGDPEALAAALARALAGGEGWRRVHGAAARARAEALFGRERHADDYAELLRAVAGAPGVRRGG